MKLHTARLYVLLSAVLWSSGGLIAKIVTLRPLSLTLFRGVTGLIFLSIFLYISGKRGPASGEAVRPGISGKKRYAVIVAGAVAYGCSSLCFFLALRMTTAANSTFLQHTAPVWVALLGFLFLGERAAPRHWIAIAAIFPAIALCMRGDFTLTGTLGNAIALLSGISFSFFIITMRVLDERSSLKALALGTFLTVLISIPSLYHDIIEGTLTGRDILLTSLLGIFQFALPFILYNHALPWMRVVESTILRLLEPVLVSVWVAIIVGEIPGKTSILGGVIVIAVLILLVLGNEKERKRDTILPRPSE